MGLQSEVMIPGSVSTTNRLFFTRIVQNMHHIGACGQCVGKHYAKTITPSAFMTIILHMGSLLYTQSRNWCQKTQNHCDAALNFFCMAIYCCFYWYFMDCRILLHFNEMPYKQRIWEHTHQTAHRVIHRNCG